ncbi:MAG: OsmC family protein [Xanthomonadales bacterium]|nr:OsmC family protein [Xanthomonadales bacterium]
MSAEARHRYRVDVEWTGNLGSGTKDYRSYRREHTIRVAGKPVLAASSDRAFHGDPARHNPEDLLLAALSSCHMLSYLHMAMLAGVVVTAYVDAAEGVMETAGNGGRFVEVVLHPVVTISAASDPVRAEAAHEAAHHACFIANSVNFPVRCEPRTVIAAI